MNLLISKIMTTLSDLKRYYWEQAKLHPYLADEMQDIVELAYSEVDEGGSETHEVSLAYNDILNLIEDFDNNEKNKNR